MNFDWKEYLTLAERLQMDGGQACFRSSISRAYYAAFCIARDKVGLKDYEPQRLGDVPIHKKVIFTLRDSKKMSEKETSLILDQLRKMRNDADYLAEMTVTSDYVDRAISKSKEILQKISLST
jgi:uncharacterized protein (UPF0332 family)